MADAVRMRPYSTTAAAVTESDSANPALWETERPL